MSYVLDRPGYCIRIYGGFIDDGEWLIHGVVEYNDGLEGASRKDVVAEAQLQLFLAIARKSRLARARGARYVHVVVDGDSEVASFFRDLDRPASQRSVNARLYS